MVNRTIHGDEEDEKRYVALELERCVYEKRLRDTVFQSANDEEVTSSAATYTIAEAQESVAKIKSITAEMEVLGTEASKKTDQKKFAELMGLFRTEFIRLTDIKEKAGRTGDGTNPPASVKLPSISLPTFNGDYLKWQSFRDVFRSSIAARAHLSRAQRLTYLKACLEGPAALLIGSLSITDANYTNAWAMLEKRYQVKHKLIRAQMDRLMTLPFLKTLVPADLIKMIDITTEVVRCLKDMLPNIEQGNPYVVHIVESRLDPETRQWWDITRNGASGNAESTLDDLTEFIVGFAQSRQENPKIVGASQSSKSQPRNEAKKSYHTSLNAACPGCEEEVNHTLFRCDKFRERPVDSRRTFVKTLNYCFNCLRPGHMATRCPTKFSCAHCQKKHNTLLHLDEATSKPPVSHSATTSSNIMLGTALIEIQDGSGRWVTCRALLDNCSMVSLITEDCRKRLKLKGKSTSGTVSGVGGSSSSTSRVVEMKARPKTGKSSQKNLVIQATAMERVTSTLPTRTCDVSSWSHIKGLPLADPHFNRPAPVDILLGADVWIDVTLAGRRDGGRDVPSAFETTLGWVMIGRNSRAKSSSRSCFHVLQDEPKEPEVSDQLSRFWEVEQVPENRFQSKEHQAAHDHFYETYDRTSEGRFVVEYPLKSSIAELGESYKMAECRFRSFERRLQGNEKLRSEATKFMEDYISLGHMEEVPSNEICRKGANYLPYHAVINEASTTTKVRIVFDASAETKTGVSFNQCQMVGPTVQDDIFAIMVMFRMNPVALIGDLEKMYRQILVSPKQQDLQRIIWRSSPTEKIRHFRLRTVTYGTASAPFLAIQCLRELAKLEEENHPVAAAKTLKNFYVDDFVSGTENPKQAIRLMKDMVELMRKGGFTLRKWASNSLEVLKKIPEDLRAVKDLSNFDEAMTKTLGLNWYHQKDVFGFDVACKKVNMTKRGILSEIAKVFDPLGLLGPVTIRAKILMQDIWKTQLGWDDLLPQDIQDTWNEYKGDVVKLSAVKIPRCVLLKSSSRRILQCFCDASESAYAACIYLVTEENGQVISRLIAAKTKVAPSNKVSLPRLELCAAVLLCHLYEAIKDLVGVKPEDVFAWSDSTITLGWIAAESYAYQTFVANRIAEVNRILPSTHWRHVSSEDNPADLGSRGVPSSSLLDLSFWWEGPSWIALKPSEVQFQLPSPEDERKKCQPASIKAKADACWQAIVNVTGVGDPSLVSKYSDMNKLIATTAWILRFKNNAKKGSIKNLSPTLDVSERRQAQLAIVRGIQKEVFAKEYQALIEKKPLPRDSKLLKLQPFLDDCGTMRVRGRLGNADLPFNKKHPAILPTKHEFVDLLLMWEHKKHLHCGPALLESVVARNFWILRCRDICRQVVNKCWTCFKLKKDCVSQIMADLPKARVEESRAFTHTGVDYAGPMEYGDRKGRGCKRVKGYIVVFVCFSTHAIHLEFAGDLSTATFLGAFRRFVSTRGKPAKMYSDQGTNFKGASNQLRQLQKLSESPDVTKKLAEEGISWIFNPPYSPHFGGLWEAGVKSTKHHLTRAFGSLLMTFEEFLTALKQIEGCLNSRPLMPRSSDPRDLEPLTPGHFLIGAPLTAVPEEDVADIAENRLDRWNRVQRVKQRFWSRWRAEYLTRLQSRPKWWYHKDIKEGTMVVLKEDPVFNKDWRMARVHEVRPGPDGAVRVVTLWLGEKEKFVTKPVTKISILPLDSDQVD